jgi:integrase
MSARSGYVRSAGECAPERRVFRPAFERAGIEPIRFHDLRRVAASLMIAANVPIKMVQEQLGHSSAKVTMDVYGHLYEATKDELTNALDAIARGVARP